MFAQWILASEFMLKLSKMDDRKVAIIALTNMPQAVIACM